LNKSEQQVLSITAIVLIIITASAIYRYQTGDNDPINGTISNNDTVIKIGGGTWGFGDLFIPERALSHGIPGYVEVTYATEPPKTTIVRPGEKVTYSIELSLVPFMDNFTETIVVLDPDRGGKSGINHVTLNDHVSYDNITCFTLSLGNPVKVNMVYSVSGDAEYGFALPSSGILGEGINAKIPVKTTSGGSYSRNALWDFQEDKLLGATEVMDNLPSANKTPGVTFNKYWAVASKLDSMLRTGEMPRLNEVFVYHYPDWSNGTAYVALTDISEETTTPILALFSEDIAENIRFIHAPAPLKIVEEWIQHIQECSDALEENGVRWTSLSVYYDGRILVGVEEINQKTVEVFNRVLWRIPRGAYVLVESGPLVLE